MHTCRLCQKPNIPVDCMLTICKDCKQNGLKNTQKTIDKEKSIFGDISKEFNQLFGKNFNSFKK